MILRRQMAGPEPLAFHIKHENAIASAECRPVHAEVETLEEDPLQETETLSRLALLSLETVS